MSGFCGLIVFGSYDKRLISLSFMFIAPLILLIISDYYYHSIQGQSMAILATLALIGILGIIISLLKSASYTKSDTPNKKLKMEQ
jgi:hypothetical protein